MQTSHNPEYNAEKDIFFSRTVKAGKRIYYVDVKRSRNDDFYVALTESKKVVTGEGEDARVSFEKHKIFLYQEDFENFLQAITDAVGYVEQNKGKREPRPEEQNLNIDIDIDF